MKYAILSTILLAPLVITAQLSKTKIFETEKLKFAVSADCRIVPYEGRFVKNDGGPSMVGDIGIVTVSESRTGLSALATNSPRINHAY